MHLNFKNITQRFPILYMSTQKNTWINCANVVCDSESLL